MDGWTKELPRLPGYYWQFFPDAEEMVVIEKITRVPDGLTTWDSELHAWRSVEDMWGDSGVYWWGPLIAPPLAELERERG